MRIGQWVKEGAAPQFTGDRPASMAAGHRISIKDLAAVGDGAELVIEALGGGADDVILEEVPATAPVAGSGAGNEAGGLVHADANARRTAPRIEMVADLASRLIAPCPRARAARASWRWSS